MKKEIAITVNGKHLTTSKPINLRLDNHCPRCNFVCKKRITETTLEWYCPICNFEFYLPYTPSEFEKHGLVIDDFKKEILKTWFGRFMLWTLDRLSQMMNWIEIKVKKQ